MFKHILLPTDGSPLSEAAVEKGIDFAKSMHARITGLCVVPKDYPSYYDAEIPGGVKERAEAERKANAKIHLSALTRVARGAGVACDVVMETCDQPYEAIVKWPSTRAATSSRRRPTDAEVSVRSCSAARLKRC